MQQIIAENLSKAYGDTIVLSGVSLSLRAGERLGVVGANGSGKTTLLRILAGEIEPDGGSVRTARGVTLGYLPQVVEPPPDQSVAAYLAAAQGDLQRAAQALRAAEHALADAGSAGSAGSESLGNLLAAYAESADEFERRGGYAGHRVDEVLAGLGLADMDRARLAATLSGGEKTRLALAALLLRSPDVLLLDEPTNHLDFAALGWLEEYLARRRWALLAVSHDRRFLNRTVNAILELDEHTHEARLFPGDYDAYAALKAQERARREQEWQAQQEETRALRRFIKTGAVQVAHNRPGADSDGFYYHFKGGRVDATAARNVRAAEEKLRRLEENPLPRPPRPLVINPDFNPTAFGSKTPLAASQIVVRYGERVLLDEVTCTVAARARVAVVGENGAGKSTLLRVLAGETAPDSGGVAVAPGVVIGRLAQEQETLPTSGTLYDAYAAGLEGDFETLKADLLGLGLFTWPDLLKPIAGLSAGQKRKLQLALLVARRANLLLLDEPTNHLSLDVVEEFERALLEFAGPVVAVSHDRRFIERFAAEVWELRDGQLRRYAGGWEEFATKAEPP